MKKAYSGSAESEAENGRVAVLQAARRAVLWQLDRFFPPDPGSFLDAAAQTQRSMDLAESEAGSYLIELGSGDVDVLDFGCGWGGETLWLARHVRSVVGVDIEEAANEQAKRTHAGSSLANCRFVHSRSGVLPFPDCSFDAVFSTNAFEHVIDLDAVFSELFRVLRPGGVVLSRFGPLFFSPHGYHLYWACQVPYAHLLCGLDAVLALRNARCDTPREATTWQSLGLNGYRYRDYRKSAAAAGFTLERFDRIAVRGLGRLAALEGIGDYLTFGIDCRLQRPKGGHSHFVPDSNTCPPETVTLTVSEP